jgi:hypothetical protein
MLLGEGNITHVVTRELLDVRWLGGGGGLEIDFNTFTTLKENSNLGKFFKI